MSELLVAAGAGLIGMVGWGVADFMAANALKKQKMTELASALWLHLFGAGVVFVFFAGLLASGAKIEMPAINLFVVWQLIVFALMNLVVYLFFFKALSVGDLGVISSVFSTYAAGAVVVSAFLFGEQIPTLRWLALLVIVSGVVLMSITSPKELKRADGIIWVIPAVVIFSLFFPLWDNLTSRGGSIVLVLLIDSLISVMFLVYAKIKSVKVVFPSKAMGIMLTAGGFNAVAGLAVAWGFETTSLTSVVAVLSSAVPLTSAFLGYVFLKERLAKIQYFGLGAILMGGVLLFV